MMTTADRILYLIAALALPLLFYLGWGPQQDADYVDVYVDNQVVRHISLAGQEQIDIVGALGPSVLEIDHGRVRFNHSPCKGKVCIHRGWLQHGGDFHACLPNRVSIALRSEHSEYDSINF